MPWNMFWLIVLQIVLFAVVTAIPVGFWFLVVASAITSTHKKFTYRG